MKFDHQPIVQRAIDGRPFNQPQRPFKQRPPAFIAIRRLLVFVWCLLTTVTCSYLDAQEVRFPNPNTIKGFRVEIQPSWSSTGASSMRYFRVSINASTARSSDLDLNVVVMDPNQRSYYRNETPIKVIHPVTLEAGKTKVEAEIYVPVSGNTSDLNVIVDRNRDGQYNRGDLCRVSINPRGTLGQGFPKLLVVNSKLKSVNRTTVVCDTRGRYMTTVGSVKQTRKNLPLPKVEQLYEQYTGNSAVLPLSQLVAYQEFQTSGIDELPAQWKGLMTFDIIFISANDLQALQNWTDKRQALEDWVAAGGSLVVTDTGKKFEKAMKVRELLTGERQFRPDVQRPWRIPERQYRDRLLLKTVPTNINGAVIGGFVTEEAENTVGFQRLDNNTRSKSKTVELSELKADQFFVLYRHGLGRVACCKSDLSKATQKQMVALVNALNTDGRGINERIDFLHSSDTLNSSFNIPSVGLPPIRTFILFISLFLFLAGPVSFFVLKRTRRMQLLFVVVPTISILACSALFGYAILSDGIELRGRAESFTALDHSQSHSVSFVRQAFFAGSEPAPYSFEPNAIVVPWADSNTTSVIRELPDQLKLSGGNIRSRVPHQIVSIHNKDNDAQIGIEMNETGSKAINLMGVPTLMIFYCDANGKLHMIDNRLAHEQSAEGTPIRFHQMVGMIKDYRESQETEDETQFETSNRYRNYYYYQNSHSSDRDVDNSLKRLLTKKDPRMNKPGSYLAILDQYPSFLDPPDENVNYKMQFHAVYGER